MPSIHQYARHFSRFARQQSTIPTQQRRLFRGDPLVYCRDYLQVHLTPTQEEICRLLVTPPYKVLVRSGHNLGKSFLAACMVNWWYDSYDPSVCLTTAPTDRQVKDILWKEVRRLRANLPSKDRMVFPGPRAPRMESGPEHFAHGFTARDGDRFQGQHSDAVFIVFDEAEGVAPIFWEAAETMLAGNHYAFLAIYNPTTQAGPTVEAERSGDFHVVTMSSLDHPNIIAELKGEVPEYPSAIRLARLQDMMIKWSSPATQGQAGAIELNGRWYLPGPVARARLLGQRPGAGFNSVWPEWAFDTCVNKFLPLTGPFQLGVDCAAFGDDDSAFHLRRGGCSIIHESYNGLKPDEIALKCRDILQRVEKEYHVPATRIPIAIDICGGYGLGPWRELSKLGYLAVGINAANTAPDPDEYPNVRSALWFGLADEAAAGNLSLGRLTRDVQKTLRQEVTAPRYELDIRGRRVVEPKHKTKEEIGRSPDNAEAMLMAYFNLGMPGDRMIGRVDVI
jgi:hypothetical protein